MPQLAEPAEIYLLPGDFHFSDENTRIHTVLGSCISIALWHPLLRIGGMCHFVLPNRLKRLNHEPKGHYADEAIELMLHEISKRNTRPSDYHVKLFGGGNMFEHVPARQTLNIARDNIEAARILLKAHGFVIQAEHVGGNGHRRIIFDLHDGSVLMKHRKL
ncbi:MAG: chemotaxis protein CheD [Gallionella sp.]|nr:chemotaxis protein CheD [Gallionella sp.]